MTTPNPLVDKNVTGSSNDTVALAELPKGQVESVFYIVYVKGTEDFVIMEIDYELLDLSAHQFSHSFVEVGGGYLVHPLSLRLDVAGKFRIPLPISTFESKVRLKFKANVPGANPGKVTVYHQHSYIDAPNCVKKGD